jgi:hypothetical protein
MTMIRVAVKDLQDGDVLTTGTVVGRPYASVKCPSGKLHVALTNHKGETYRHTWNRGTLIVISR